MKRHELKPRTGNLIKIFLMAGLFSLLMSCGGILESGNQPERTYWLEPLAGSPAPPAAEGPVLTVRVTVVPGLDSDRLLTIGPGPELSRFSAARWPGNLPEYVASLLIRSLSATGHYKRVTRDAGARLDACDLEMEVSRFYTRLGESRDPRAVEISMAGTFQCSQTMHPLRFEHREALTGRRMADVVAAHQRAMDRVTEELASRLADLKGSEPKVASDHS